MNQKKILLLVAAAMVILLAATYPLYNKLSKENQTGQLVTIPQQEKPAGRNQRGGPSPRSRQLQKGPQGNEDPAQPQINKFLKNESINHINSTRVKNVCICFPFISK